MEKFQEKFKVFFNQFDSDDEIALLFQYLDLILSQYKIDPVKVCGINLFTFTFKKKNECILINFSLI